MDLDKDNGGGNSEDLVELSENAKFILFTSTVHVHLLDAINGEFMVLERERMSTWSEFFGVGNDTGGESGTPEKDLSGTRNSPRVLVMMLVRIGEQYIGETAHILTRMHCSPIPC